jgi:hypothetical protein
MGEQLMQPILMQMLKWTFFLVACILGGYLHWEHAQKNYPFSTRWRFLLFMSGFLAGTLGFWGLMVEYGLASIVVSMATGGISLGLISLFWFPKYMQSFCPRK